MALLTYTGHFYLLMLLACSSMAVPRNFDHVGSPAPQPTPDEDAPARTLQGMEDIIWENRAIDGEGNAIEQEHGHIIEADIFEEVEPEEEEGGVAEGEVVEGEEGTTRRRTRRNAIRDRESLWPGGAVPYVIDGYFNNNHKKHILAAMQRFHEKTCIRFVPRTIERDYIFFTQNLGCWSMVGRTGGRQKISLSGTCRSSRGVVIHELMHAVGFRHEHNRPDRDGYIDVYWQNIKEGFTTNFRKYTMDQVQTLGTGYDFLSIMHYPLTAFSKDGNSVTIGPKYPSYQIGDVGNRDDFSHIDSYRINTLYKCGQCEDTDKYYCPIWAMMGECKANKEWMTKYCPFSCDRCTIALAKGDGLACIDQTSNCKRWAKIGECERNPAYMMQGCRRSCKQCMAVDTETGEEDILSCNDDNTLCHDWATLGECTSNAKFMKKHCRRSCHVCTGGDGRIIIDNEAPDCQDTTIECAIWSTQNLCKEMPEWMATRCRRTCLWCSPQAIVETPNQADESRVDDEFTRSEDERSRPGDEEEIRGSNGEGAIDGEEQQIEVSDGEVFGDKSNRETSMGGEGEEESRDGDTYHTEGELYGGNVNSTGWSRPQGCVDEHDVCGAWAEDGDCATNPEWMAIKCPVSCGLCGDTGIEPPCVDRHRNCSYWAMVGECDAFPDWMHVKCPESCGLCGTPPSAESIEGECRDRNPQCPQWAETTRCRVNQGYMQENCQRSCNWCPPEETCVDADPGCEKWARGGHCLTNEDGLRAKCQKSCGHCGEVQECRDVHRKCRQWSKEQWCTRSPLFMRKFCAPACGLCDDNRPGNNHTAGEVQPETVPTTTKLTKTPKLTKKQKQQQLLQQQQLEEQRVVDNFATLSLAEVQEMLADPDNGLTPKQLKALKRIRKQLKQNQARQEKELRALQKAAKRNNQVTATGGGVEREPIREGLDEAAIEG